MKMYKVTYLINGSPVVGTVYASSNNEAIKNQKTINSKRARLKNETIEYIEVVEV